MKRFGCVTALLFIGGLLTAVSCSSDDDETNAAASGGSPGSGGVGGGEGGSGELVLVSRAPEAGDENGWALAPVELVFSEALDEATLEAAIRVQAAGKDVALSITLDDSKKRVSVALDAVPALPAKLSLSVTSDLHSEAGHAFAGDAWSFSFPLWQRPAGAVPATLALADALALGVDGQRGVFVVAPLEGGGLSALRHESGAWSELPAPPSTDLHALPVGGAFDAGGGFVVVWREGEVAQSLHAARFANDEWSELGEAIASGAELTAAVGFAADGLAVAVQTASSVSVYTYDAEVWTAGSAFAIPGGAPSAPELSVAYGSDGASHLAVVNAAGDVVLASDSAGTWATLGTIDRARSGGTVRPRIVLSGDKPTVAYVDGDALSTNVQVAEYDGGVKPLGAALDVELDAQATAPSLGVDPDGQLTVAWHESWGDKKRVYAARFVEQGWRVLGSAAAADIVATNGLRIAFDADGNVNLAWLSADEPSDLQVSRFNGSPSLPHGLASAGTRGDCAIPTDDVGAAFPQTLSATGCYTNLVNRALVSAAIPFSLNSALWSDGALKKRYLLLPEGGTVDYVSEGALGMPVGTILIKEFYVERVTGDPSTVAPMETRFLVKRLADDANDASWQGYSYKWNDAGTDGVLLDGVASETEQWAITDGNNAAAQHMHSYPSRAECITCHNAPSGRVLGLQSVQLNRPQEYADGVIENQLSAWVFAGVFGTTEPSGAAEGKTRLSSPPDVGRSLDERARAYFHSNCSHCHRMPDGSRNTIDFRYFTDVSTNGICDFVTQGAHATSKIWQNDSHRGPEDLGPDTIDSVDDINQMPPLATRITDDRQLAVTAAWIDSMSTCP